MSSGIYSTSSEPSTVYSTTVVCNHLLGFFQPLEFEILDINVVINFPKHSNRPGLSGTVPVSAMMSRRRPGFVSLCPGSIDFLPYVIKTTHFLLLGYDDMMKYGKLAIQIVSCKTTNNPKTSQTSQKQGKPLKNERNDVLTKVRNELKRSKTT